MSSAGRSASCREALPVDHVAVRTDVDLREAGGEILKVLPMRRRAASVQEPGHREHQRSRLHTADRNAAACNAAERGEKPRLRVDWDIEGRNDDERAADVVCVEAALLPEPAGRRRS